MSFHSISSYSVIKMIEFLSLKVLAIFKEDMLMTSLLAPYNRLRDIITNAYRMNETECLNLLIPQATLPEHALSAISAMATELVVSTREYKKTQSRLVSLLHQYDLSTEEGVALMCLAEALLRIPDTATVDKFISDKLSNVEWKAHLHKDNALFVNATTWSLLLTGKIYGAAHNNQSSLTSYLKRATSRLGVTMIRPIIRQMMQAIGGQFVMGEDIDSALNRATQLEEKGYYYSYDMLGEAARTAEDAKHYYDSYVATIDAIGNAAKTMDPTKNPGISVKLSALHPRYDYTQRDRVLKDLPPLLLALAQQAKKYHIGLTVDAEEADRLDLSLDIIEIVFSDPSLSDWDGFGLAVQAYQKRASFVIDWLADLSKRHGKRLMVRLVKGAYWDAEIKTSQVQGFSDYPVFTRKNATDVSYLACAKKLLSSPECFYAQFGTHNAYSVAAILQMAGNQQHFEFQCLHGMGQPLYDQIVDKAKFNRPCRIYAPVGTHKDLLGYLVRRLLENGANSSFINSVANEKTPIKKIVIDPVARIASLPNKSHPYISLPKNLYSHWENSLGIDLSNAQQFRKLQEQIKAAAKEDSSRGIIRADEGMVEEALKIAKEASHSWGETSVNERAMILERAAELFQQEMPQLIALLQSEGGKCLLDSISEVRETIDYCRYYAYRARCDLTPTLLPGPTGEKNYLSLHPRGVVACISPWNFPLAIFSGQMLAALVTGNAVLAKPAEQTPLIAFKAVQILYKAGVPQNALHLVIGRGSVVGAKIVSDTRIAGVIFTGSTDTAKLIEQSLAKRSGPIAFFIAETGGQNAMIVDSSALAEQAVMDITQSAFNSAGQRCSALRVLFVQEEIAPTLLSMLKGYMTELKVGDPHLLSTDIGPVIDKDALQRLQAHASKMHQEATLLAQVPLENPPAGHYFAPCLFELKDLSILEGEVFGPILHVIRYAARDLDTVIETIINSGYGLTLGIHSRIDATIQYIANRMPVGNMYVNRNMIGAVVGVQPFGGERLSGTGPKAGGPHYLPRLCVERSISTNTTAIGGNAYLVSLLEED
jgi:RHH-type proline utilization regulon transcriptional repressor/proline dehydrogenase/delta 1-pyrroline-5-carboxylate dehydrogenase